LFELISPTRDLQNAEYVGSFSPSLGWVCRLTHCSHGRGWKALS